MSDAADRYFAGLSAQAAALGLAADSGTAVVAEPERAGTRSATSYPAPGLTIVFVDPDLCESLADLEGPEPTSTDDFVARATAKGAELAGIGHQRVLVDELVRPDADATGLSFRVLDRDDPDVRRRLADLIDVCDPDDVDEADLDLDGLDPVITALVDVDGRLAAYASARPWEVDDRFDDIAVLTAPAFRGRRLGALAVHDLVSHQRRAAPDRLPLYRCNADNVGSNRTAESLGFTLIQRIGAMRFPDPTI